MGSDAGNRAVGDMTAPIEPSRSEESSGISQAGPENPPFKASRSLVLAFVSICIITLAAALDATSLSIAVPTITEHLSGTAIEAFWSGTSFLIASAVVQPVFGGLSHVFGRKNLILVSAFLFALGSLIPAVAPNFTVLYVLIWITCSPYSFAFQTGWTNHPRPWRRRGFDARGYRYYRFDPLDSSRHMARVSQYVSFTSGLIPFS